MTEPLEKIQSALAVVSPDLHHDEWVKVGMALHSAGCDFSVFDEWSKPGRSYKSSAARDTWKSFKPGGGIGIGTLYAMAQENGWTWHPEHETRSSAPARKVAPSETAPERKPNNRNYRDYLDRCAAALFAPEGAAALSYLHGRGLTDEILKAAHVGYDAVCFFPSLGRTDPAVILPYNAKGTYYASRNLEPDKKHRAFAKPRTDEAGDEPVFDPLGALTNDSAPALFASEGQLDALSIAQCGHAAVAIGGTGAGKLTAALTQNKPSRPLVYLADNDEPGIRFAERVSEELAALGIRHIIRTVPDANFKDANDALKADPEALARFLAQCVKDAQEVPEPQPQERELTFDLSSATAEDFRARAVYEWIVDSTDEFIVTQREQDAKNVAVNLGVGKREFNGLLKTVRNEKIKSSHTGSESYVYTWDELGGVSNIVPSDYLIEDGSVFRVSPNGGRSLVIGHPWAFCGRRVDRDTDETSWECTWKREESGKQSRVFGVDQLNFTRGIPSVSVHNVDIGDSNAKLFCELCQRLEGLNQNLPVSVSTKKLGWYGKDNEEFVPYKTGAVYCGSFQGISSSGTLEGWKAAVLPARRYSATLRFVMGAAVAAILAKPIGLPESGEVHISARTGAGKTVSQRIAASIFGSPAQSGGYVQSLESTDAYLEGLAGSLVNLPVILDESEKRKTDALSVSNFMYKVAGNTSKGRADRSGEARKTSSWQTFFITSGESPLTGSSSKGGEQNRAIELQCNENPLFKSTDSMSTCIDTVMQNYGVAALPVIEYIQSNTPALVARFHSVANTLSEKHGVSGKQSKLASAILLGDHVLHTAFFAKSEDEMNTLDILPFVRKDSEIGIGTPAYEAFTSAFMTQRGRFVRKGSAVNDIHIIRDILGVYDEVGKGNKAPQVVYCTRETLAKILKEGYRPDVNIGSVLSEWDRSGKITTARFETSKGKSGIPETKRRLTSNLAWYQGEPRIPSYGILLDLNSEEDTEDFDPEHSPF